ncbi:hypothetical protein ACSBPH_01790 [Microbacterium sp. F51-2R]|uniref:hypothetical protein n=1 Tax=Microbacterium sp. F51-2R TaxID=3445777 RepID=UPI003F9F31C4
MGDTTRRDVARARALEAMRIIRDTIENTPDLNKVAAAQAAGIAPSSFYRWLSDATPKKVDVIQISALADYLHDEHGAEDFVTLWRRVTRAIK